MTLYMVSFSVSTNGNLSAEDGECDARKRRNAAYEAAFSLGPAWHGGQTAVFLRTEAAPTSIVHAVEKALSGGLVVVAEVSHDSPFHFSGIRFDEDGFDSLIPNAVDLSEEAP